MTVCSYVHADIFPGDGRPCIEPATALHRGTDPYCEAHACIMCQPIEPGDDDA